MKNEKIVTRSSPNGLKAFRRRWYLIANSVEMGGIYAFALDRVRSMVSTAKAAEIPSDFDCAGFYADAFGIIRERDREAERVEIRVLGKQANYVRALPLHPTQRETERTAEYSVFEYRLAPTYDFRMELLLERRGCRGVATCVVPGRGEKCGC